MKRLLFTTTALVAVASAAPAFADVSVTGKARFTYENTGTGEASETYDPYYEVWGPPILFPEWF